MIHNFIKEDHKQIKEDVQEMKSFVEQFDALKLERDALWVKTQEDEREINQLMASNKERLIQRTQLIEIAEELADVIISNGASVKDAIPIDKLDDFCIRWGIKEPFKRNYSA